MNDYGENTLKACALWREREVYLDLVEELIIYFHKQMPKDQGRCWALTIAPYRRGARSTGRPVDRVPARTS